MSLPKNLLYANKVNASSARAYTSNIQPTGSSTYSPNDVAILNIPCNPNTVLSGADSFLKFSVTATNGATANPYVRMSKAGAHGLIARVRLFSPNGVLLEDVSEYGNLLAMLATHQRSADKNTGVGSVSEGFDESVCLVSSLTTVAPVGAMVNSVRGLRIANPLYDSAVTLGANATTSVFTFAIPLVSIVGSLTDKYFPLFACSGMGALRLEIQFASNASIPFVAPQVLSTFTISNLEYVGQFIELSDQAIGTIRASLGGGDLAMAVDRWANISYSATLATAVTQVSMPVPFKYSSITSLLLTQRLQSTLGPASADNDAYASAHFNILEYYLNLGSMTVPTKRPNDLAQIFNLYQQALGSPGDIGYAPNVCRQQYITQPLVVASTEVGGGANVGLDCIQPSFALGMDMSSYPSSDSSGMFSGFNSQSVDIFWNIIYNANASAIAVRYDAYCGHQAVLTFGANGVQIRY